MDIVQYYQELTTTSAQIQEHTFNNSDTLAGQHVSHGYLADLEVFYYLISHRHEAPILQLAIKEYQFALFALSIGQYRHAYIGLRLFFEMIMACFLFSTNEIDFKLWERNAKDINWQELIDQNKGVFSNNYCKAFNEELAGHIKPFLTIATTVYRECSEYVHGNLHTHQKIPSHIKFDKEICDDWHQKSKSMYLVIVFLFSLRHLPSFDSSMSNNQKLITYISRAKAIISSELGHIDVIRDQL
jgi:hypothetical protein